MRVFSTFMHENEQFFEYFYRCKLVNGRFTEYFNRSAGLFKQIHLFDIPPSVNLHKIKDYQYVPHFLTKFFEQCIDKNIILYKLNFKPEDWENFLTLIFQWKKCAHLLLSLQNSRILYRMDVSLISIYSKKKSRISYSKHLTSPIWKWYIYIFD